MKQHEWFDEIGKVLQNPEHHNKRVFAEPVEIGSCLDMKEFVTSMSKVTYEARIPSNSDILVIQFKGSSEHLAQVLTFLADSNRHNMDIQAFESVDSTDCR